MSLREELWKIGYQSKEANPIFKAYEQKDMDTIINKILDAAVKSVRDECNSTDLNDLAGFEIEDMVVEAIQRLKEGK